MQSESVRNADRTILVVEDDEAMRELLVESLADEGYQVISASGGREGIKHVGATVVDLVITDLRMQDMDGLDMIRELRMFPSPPGLIMITAFGSMDTAIKAMKLGALDYITKPFEVEQLLLSVERALQGRQLRLEVERLREEVADRYRFDNIVGRSASMKEVFELIRRVADSMVNVLVTGESGTGKELVARALHYNSSRAKGPFMAINCAAIPANLLESELFGHKRGAFTDAVSDRSGLLAEANGGTVFLDEIGEFPLPLQAKLLRVLQEREIKPVGSSKTVPIDVRVLSATNRSLADLIETGEFRTDLFYRLNVVEIVIPPLRDRPEDILPIAGHLLAKVRERSGRQVAQFSPQAAKALIAYRWPGNVRELENIIERAVALARSGEIEVDDLPAVLFEEQPVSDLLAGAAARGFSLAELEQAYLVQILDEEGGNKSRAAIRLGLDRKTLYRKLEEYRKLATG